MNYSTLPCTLVESDEPYLLDVGALYAQAATLIDQRKARDSSGDHGLRHVRCAQIDRLHQAIAWRLQSPQALPTRDTFLGMMGMPITPSARKVSHEL